MRLGDLAQRVGKDPSTIMRWVDQRRYGIPQPYARNGNTVIWADNEITRWLHKYRNMIGARHPNGSAKRRVGAAGSQVRGSARGARRQV